MANGTVLIYNSKGEFLKEVLAEPAYRNVATGKTVVKLETLAPNSPKAIEDWFYPGEQIGAAFVYPQNNS